MTDEQAAWIREHTHRPQHGRRLMQPRRMGQAECLHLATPECGQCRAGHHASCTGTSWSRLHETWILDSHGSDLYWSSDTPHLVWTAPRPCACTCRTVDAQTEPDASAAVRESSPARPRRAHNRSGISHPDQVPVCACQWGPTTHCLHGDHGRCSAHTVLTCETHLTYADGTCVLDRGGPVEVWLAGRACTWVCACSCHTEHTDPSAAPAPVLTMAGGWEQPGLPI